MNFTLPGGASAILVSSDGHHVSLRCTLASPPGSTLRASAVAAEAAVNADNADSAQTYAVKVRGCQKESDGRFLITGRFVSLSRTQRAFLLGQATTGNDEPQPSASSSGADSSGASS